MLRFVVYDASGRPANDFALRHAHAFGPDELPVQAHISCEGGVVTVQRGTADATGLCVQMDTPGTGPEAGSRPPLGLLTLQTALLPQRDEPYILTLELARRQIMLFLNKLEEWGLFDWPAAEPIVKEFEVARQMFTRALVASRAAPSGPGDDPRAKASVLAMESLVLAADAGERLAVCDAERQLPVRMSGRGYADAVRHYTRITAENPAAGAAIALASATGVYLPGLPQIGCTVEPTQFAEPLQKAAVACSDFVSVPMRWSEMEPSEGKYSFAGTDRWIEWAVRAAKLPVVAGPLLDFRGGSVPEWLYIWENDYETLRELVVEHLQQIVTRYRRTVNRWVVASGLHVNGDIKLSVDQIIDLTRVAVAVVRKLHPTGRIQLEIAQPWGEYHARSKRSLPPLLYADAIIQVGLNVDTLGLRLQMGQAASGRSTRDLMTLSSLLDRYAAFQRPIAVSALGVPSIPAAPAAADDTEPYDPGWWRKPWSEQTQADWTSQAIAIALAKPFVQSVCWQQLADAPPGGFTEMPSGGLVSPVGAAKPVLQRVIQIRQAVKEGRVPQGIPGLGQL